MLMSTARSTCRPLKTDYKSLVATVAVVVVVVGGGGMVGADEFVQLTCGVFGLSRTTPSVNLAAQPQPRASISGFQKLQASQS